MSTLAATNLKHASSASNNIVLDSSGNATFAGTAVPSSSFLRNRIINGDMRIDQRNAGASVTPTDGQYLTDRFVAGLTAASKFTVQQSSTAPTGFSNSLLITSSSAYSVGTNDAFTVGQKIEGFNFADFMWGTANAVTVTLSFWVRSSLTGTFGGAITNSGDTRSYPFSYAISVANTWEQKIVTIAGDTSGTWVGSTNGVGARVWFGLGVGTTYSGTAGAWVGSAKVSVTGATSVVGTNGATFYITGVQLEVGTAATPFERRQYGQELLLCQRYYEANVNTNAGLGTATGFSGSVTSGSNYYVSTSYLVQKRAAPTITLYNANLASFPSAAVAAATGTTSFLMSGTANGTNTGGFYFYDFAASAEL